MIKTIFLFALFNLTQLFADSSKSPEPSKTLPFTFPQTINPPPHDIHGNDASEPKKHTFNISLEPLHYTVIFSQITSPVIKINKKMGDAFEENELLMELDKKVFEGNFLKTKALVSRYTTEYQAKKRLFQDDALSEFELNESYAALKGAEAEYALAEKGLESTEIRAPYKGKVVKITVKEYELAQLGKELITLVDDDFLYAKFLVPSTLVNCLKKGMPLDISIRETGQKLTAKILHISPVIDPSSATITVEAEIDNKDHMLWAGMSGRVEVTECKNR